MSLLSFFQRRRQASKAANLKPVSVPMTQAHWFWLTLLVLLTQAQLFLYVPTAVALFGVGLTLVRVAMLYAGGVQKAQLQAQMAMGEGAARYRKSRAPIRWSAWASLVLGIVSIAVVRMAYGYLFYRDASVGLLFLLVAIKFSESKSQRDAMVLICLASFLLITTFFYTQSPLTLLTSLLAFFALGGALDALFRPAMPLAWPRVWHTLKRFGVLVLQGIPIALVLFMLFPRLSAPLWGLPQVRSAQSGLSDTMGPMDIAELSLSDAIAFRVDFEGPTPPNRQLYWRGPVFSSFDGVSWRPAQAPMARPLATEPNEKEIRYTVTLEPHQRQWLFALELPSALPQTNDPNMGEGGRRFAYLTEVQQLMSFAPVSSSLRYQQTSVLRERFPASSRDAETNMRLPREGNPRARELATRLRAEAPTPQAYVQAVLAYFHNEPFFYTLSPAYIEKDPIDGFLFDTREGFCEHYVSAFVLLMRAAQVPARVVTGYQGGEVNPQGGYLIVRQADAHAWAEVLIDGQWQRVDPTAAVAPDRIEYGLGRALPDSAQVPYLSRIDAGWLKTVQLEWDALKHGWARNVIDFNYQRQRELWRDWHLDGALWKVAAVLMGLVMLWGTALLLLLGWRARQQEPVQALWLLLCVRLARAGLPRSIDEGPSAYLARAAAHWPQWQGVFMRIAKTYIALRYGNPQASQQGPLLKYLRHAFGELPNARQLRKTAKNV